VVPPWRDGWRSKSIGDIIISQEILMPRSFAQTRIGKCHSSAILAAESQWHHSKTGSNRATNAPRSRTMAPCKRPTHR
jgi:hypothetical protein